MLSFRRNKLATLCSLILINFFSQQPTSVANIYKYINNVRTPSDASYMGSILLYQVYYIKRTCQIF